MEKFVTQEECEDRRLVLTNEISKQTADISKLYGKISALTVQISNLVTIIKWQMGLFSTVLGGLLIWLITH